MYFIFKSIHNNLTKKFPDKKKFKVIVNTHVDNFEMMIYPRWEKVLESGYLVGAEIESAPRGWNEYIAKMDRITGGSTTTSL